MTDVKIVYPWSLGGILKFKGKVFTNAEFMTADVHFVRSSNVEEPLIMNK